MRRLPLFLACIVSALFVFSCTKDVTGPPAPDTNNTMWHSVISGDIPDTLMYGSTVVFTVAVGDSDGDSVSAAVSGLPVRRYLVSYHGDTTFIAFNLPADSLEVDSVYAVQIALSGVDSVDTVTIPFSLTVIDTNRIGGIRKLVTGMWWSSDIIDTLVSHRDSTWDSIRTIGSVTDTVQKVVSNLVRDTVAHRKRSTVLIAVWSNDTGTYMIQQVDTNLNAGTRKTDTLWMRHTRNGIQVVSWIDPRSMTLVWSTMIQLPYVSGSQWAGFQASYDTSGTWQSLPYNLYWSRRDDYAGPGKTAAVFGQQSQSCYIVELTGTETGTATSGVKIALPWNLADTVFVGDTLTHARVTRNSMAEFATGIPGTVNGTGTEVKVDSNYISHVCQRDTTRSITRLLSFFDPRRGAVIIR